MPSIHVLKECPVTVTPRVLQLRGMFDLPAAETSREEWNASLPLEERPWQIGLIVGPSGCGKSTIANALWPGQVVTSLDWPADRSVVDAFPAGMMASEIVLLLSRVGFSSPPAWLRPYSALSTGQQFRATVARALAERPNLCVVDEFSSVVDRTAARIGAAAIAKTVREGAGQFVAVTCHPDVEEWLQPDWRYEPGGDSFTWRCLQPRPTLTLDVFRVDQAAWPLFAPHHYLTGALSNGARCFVALLDGHPVAFAAALRQPNTARALMWRGHRTVVLPDYQGLGIGNRLSEEVARLHLADGARYVSTTAHPAVNRHRARSPLWRCTALPRPYAARQGESASTTMRADNARHAFGRMVTAWEFVGP